MKYNITINNEYTFPLFFWDGNQFRMSNQLDLATDNFAEVKTAFESIQIFKITDSNNLEVAQFSNYDKCTSINYIGYSYSPQREEFCDEIIVNLKNTTLEAQVKQLNNQIDELNGQIEQLQTQIDELKVVNEPVEEQLEWTDLPVEETADPGDESLDEPVEEPVDSATASEEPSEEPSEELSDEQNDGAGAEYE